jgi:hypothetical protein
VAFSREAEEAVSAVATLICQIFILVFANMGNFLVSVDVGTYNKDYHVEEDSKWNQTIIRLFQFMLLGVLVITILTIGMRRQSRTYSVILLIFVIYETILVSWLFGIAFTETFQSTHSEMQRKVLI